MPSMSSRAFEKLIARLPLVDKNDICVALLEAEAAAANDVIKAINARDYRTAHELADELFSVIDQWESLAACSTSASAKSVKA